MRKIILLCATLFAITLSMSASPARAQNVMWVSPGGGDGNACSQTAPCLTFQGAYNKGSVSQINCLSSGSYGPITITTSLTIDCGTGNVGNIFSPGSNSYAITINGNSNLVLRHLSLNGLGTGNTGILTAAGFVNGSLVFEDCEVQGFGGGFYFSPSAGRSSLNVSNSRFINNSGTGIVISANGASTIVTVTLDHTEIFGSGQYGFFVQGGGVVAGAIRDSLIVGNSADGIYAGASQDYLTVDRSIINANLGVGIHAANTGANIDVYGSTIGANGTGVQASGGSIISFGNNGLNGNAANGHFTSTIGLQ